MKFLSVKDRIVLGLVTILLSTMLLVIFSGFGPDDRQATMHGRKHLCETIAIYCSVLVSRNDLAGMETTLGAIVDRNEDLLSAAVRRADGELIATVGPHDALNQVDKQRSTETQVHVPLWSNTARWGSVELCFRSISASGWTGFLQSPWTLFLTLSGTLTFILFSFYLGKVLRQLDPSKAIPKRVRSALDALAEGLLVTDKKGRVVLANEAFARWAGENADCLIGRNAGNFPWKTTDNATMLGYPWIRALEDRLPQANYVLGLTDTHDRELTLVANASPVLGHDGQYRGVLTSFEDITELEQNKMALSTAKQAADDANQAKSEFLARMSHEIRTPMNAILGYTEVLRRGFAESEKQRDEYLDTIHNSGEHLLALINDILDLSKVEAGRLELEMARHSPHAVLSQVLSVLRVKAEEKGLMLDFQAEGKLPETILTDAVRLRQAIINLVGNAIKFTDTGGVRVVARLLQRPRPLLAIDVVDTGIGISEEAMQNIFDPFSQADTTVTRRYGGTGLGLSITRQLAEKMGGEVKVSSQLGQGTTFTLTIDPGRLEGIRLVAFDELEPVESDCGRQDEDVVSLPPAHILIVDDGPENRQLVSLFLGRAGLQVATAENGQVAIKMASKNDFDAILMDMQMPVMDGITATKRLRALGYKRPIIALTANVMKEDRSRCMEAGFDSFLAKPIQMNNLLHELSQVLGTPPAVDERRSSTESSNSPATSAEKQSTLRLDDEGIHGSQMPPATAANTTHVEQNATALLSTLPTEDPEFREIVAGFVGRLRDRVSEMRQAADRCDITAVAELAHWLKGAGGGVGFDVFTTPAAELQSSAESCDDEGVERNLSRIEALVHRIQVDPVTPNHANSGPSIPTTSRAPSALASDRTVLLDDEEDLKQIQQTVADLSRHIQDATPVRSSLPTDDPEFCQIVEGFVVRLKQRVAEMTQAAAKNEFGELADMAHWLKGAGGSVGFELFTAPAAALQSSSEAQDVEGVAAHLNAIVDITRRIRTSPSSVRPADETSESFSTG